MDGINFKLNSKEVCYTGAATDRLLDVLRDDYNMKSVKCGCKEGECGACAVLIDGVLMNSCCVAMGAVDGHEIMTVEGYRESYRFKVLSTEFAKLSAVQCGFCIPGMILAAEAILSNNPHPTEEEVREGLSGNICRCTGYNAIVNAILNTAKEGDGLW